MAYTPATAQRLGALLASAPGDDAARAALRDAAVSALVVPVDEGADGAAVAWARLEAAVRRHSFGVAIARAAGDLSNVPRSGRVAVLPILRCARSAKAFPGVLSLYRKMGALLVAPFDPAVPTTNDERRAVLAAAASAGVLVDLTGLDPGALADARAALGDAPAMVALPAGDAAAIRAARRALGEHGVVVLDDAQAASFLTAESLGGDDPAGEAPVWIAGADLAGLSGAISAAEAAGARLSDADAPARSRLLRRLGGSLSSALRRLP